MLKQVPGVQSSEFPVAFRDICQVSFSGMFGKAHTLVNWLQSETQQNPSLVELRRPLSFLFWNCS
jgi:hypothetical protein